MGAANAADAPATSGADGIVSGSQVISDVVAPVTLTGNSISMVGDSSTASAAPAAPAPAPVPAPIADPTTSGTDAVASGAQAVVAADAPVTATGNAISVIGDSQSAPAAPVAAAAPAPVATPATTDGADSIAGGTQITPDVTAPVTVQGNAISLPGDSTSTGTRNGLTGLTSTPGTSTTDGEESILDGTQLFGTFGFRVGVTYNAISVVGTSSTTGTTGTTGTSTTGATLTTGATASAATGSRTDSGIATGDGTTDTSVVGSSTAALTVTSLASAGFGGSSLLAIALLLPLLGMGLLMGDRFRTVRL